MIYKNNHYSVKDILLRYPIPYISKYYGPFGLKKGAQRKWCKKMIREEGKRLRKLEKEEQSINNDSVLRESIINDRR